MIKCQNCGRQNEDTAKICVYCGAVLVDVQREAATKALGDTDLGDENPNWGSSRYTPRIKLTIVTDGKDQKTLTFDTSNLAEAAVGRVDPFTNEAPPIDLSDFGAQDKGVSRKHALLVRRDGALHIVDLGSPNGTYLNGQRLVPDQPRVLRDGDDIRLGFLVVRIDFELE